MWKFHCDAGPNSTLCFNGGSCVEDSATNRSYCICPVGFRGDFDWFHLPNCSRADSSGTILFVMGTIGICILLAYLLIVVRPMLRKDLVVLGQLSAASLLCLLTFIIGYQAQSGCFAVCAVGSNLAFILGGIICLKLIILVMKPLYGIRMIPINHFQNVLTAWTMLISAGFVATGIVMAVLSTQPDRIDEYNLAAMISAFVLWCDGCVMLTAVIVASARLSKEIKELAASAVDTSAPTHDQVSRRLRMLRIAGLLVVPVYLVLVICTPIVFSILGSAPYFYVVVYLEVVSAIAFIAGVILFLRNPSRPAGTSDKAVNPTVVHQG